MKNLKAIKRVAASFIALLTLWYLVAKFSGVNPALFPTPLKVFAAFKELLTVGLLGSSSNATLIGHIVSSLGRFAVGYFLAVVVSVPLGLVLGLRPKLYGYVDPIVQTLRPIAPVAWFPFLVLLLGIGNLPAIAIIFIAGFFPILTSTVAAVKNMDPIFFKVARNFDMGRLETVTKIVFPATFPQIVASLRLALGTCWIFLVSGEMVGAQSGLGFLVMDAKNCLRSDALLATMIVIGIIGLLLDQLVAAAERLIALKFGLGVVKFSREGDE